MLSSNSVKIVTITPRTGLDQPEPTVGQSYTIKGVVIEDTKAARENAEVPAGLRVFYTSSPILPKAGDLASVNGEESYLVSAVRDISGVMTNFKFKLEGEREALI